MRRKLRCPEQQKQWRLASFLVLLLLASTPEAVAAQSTGLAEWENESDLLRSCEAPENSHAHGVCKGMIFGATAAIIVMQKLDGKRYICPLPSTTFDDNRDAVIAYLRRDREHRDRPSLSAIMDALSEKWPCR
jgi:hypothetical protein